MSDRNYGLVKSEEELTRWVDKLVSKDMLFAFDIETGYLGPLRPKASLQHYAPDYIVAGFSFSANPDWARYVSLNHEGEENIDNLHAARELWRLLRTGNGIAHNALFELSGMGRFFRDHLLDDLTLIPGTTHTYAKEIRRTYGIYPVHSDTMLETMLLAENKAKDLKTISRTILGVPQVDLIDLFRARNLKGQNAAGRYVKYNMTNLRFNVLPLDPDVVSYACEDSALTLEHYYRTHEQIKDSFIFQIEKALTPILVEMEMEGLLLDWAEYERRSRDVTNFRDQYAEYVMDQFSELAGEVININLNSPPQVANVLFEKLGIKPTLFTDKNAPSTGEKAMRLLLDKHPEIRSLLEYREIAKLLGSYITKYLKELRYDPTGRAHPSHKQEGAGTGRFSVDQVSYQQWPKPYHYELPNGSVLDLNYRNFLIAPDEFRIIGFDYANVELRIVAGLANETAMLEAFANGVDIHKATASKMLGVPLDEVTDKQRSVGKTLNFAIVYGSGADNIASLITAATGTLCTVEDAEGYLEQYFIAFPELKAWMDERILEGRVEHAERVPGAAKHWVTTAFGRRIPIFEYQSEFRSVRNKGDRNAVNGPVQGAAADYMKIAMVRVHRAIRAAEAEGRIPEKSIRMVMTIHDALEFYVHKDVDTKTAIDIIGPAATPVVTKDYLGEPLNMPEIRADWHEGYRWGSVAEIDINEDGSLTYNRKLELADKTRHSFTADDLDTLVREIEEFFEQRNTTILDAQIIEDDDEPVWDEDLGKYVLRPRSEDDDAPPSPPKEEPEEEELPADEEPEDDEPSWLHAPEFHKTKLLLTLDKMPTTKNWPAFQELLKNKAGSASLKVLTPQGAIDFDNVGLTPDDEGELRLLFGSATLSVDRSEDQADAIMEGMSL